MAGVCQYCGEVVRALQSCPVCAARVCGDCMEEYGCQLCHGRATGAETADGDTEEEEY